MPLRPPLSLSQSPLFTLYMRECWNYLRGTKGALILAMQLAQEHLVRPVLTVLCIVPAV
jgi:hypothetical protein